MSNIIIKIENEVVHDCKVVEEAVKHFIEKLQEGNHPVTQVQVVCNRPSESPAVSAVIEPAPVVEAPASVEEVVAIDPKPTLGVY